MNNYSINIDIFRKGNYKIFSIRLMNREFEAIKHSTIDQSSDTLCRKTLIPEQTKDIEYIISALSFGSLHDEYTNRGVKGEYHLIYYITRDEEQKEIYVYYEDQTDLKRLYEKLMALVPEAERIWYYR